MAILAWTLQDGTRLYSRQLVVATGGPSIPRMGSSDFGVRLARRFGLKSIPFAPALVPFTFSQDMLDGLLAELAGVSTEITVGPVVMGSSVSRCWLPTVASAARPCCRFRLTGKKVWRYRLICCRGRMHWPGCRISAGSARKPS
ncbi:MAG: NAD(P)/FAD-dependent oxidoreductase [Thiolinea sp.]